MIVDQSTHPDLGVVMVGITPGSWIQPTTPDASHAKVPVEISVPNSWPSYTAFAFVTGNTKDRPALIGATLNNPTFQLDLKP